MASKDNQINIRLDDGIDKLVELLQDDAIKGQLEIRERVGAEFYDKTHGGSPTPPTRPELCKRILQEAIRNKAALLKPSSPGRSLSVVDG